LYSGRRLRAKQAASSKQQAASSKQQAASSKQQAASSKQQAASSKQLWAPFSLCQPPDSLISPFFRFFFSFSPAKGAVESRFEPAFGGLFIYPGALPGGFPITRR
jgi:hypothetical protein